MTRSTQSARLALAALIVFSGTNTALAQERAKVALFKTAAEGGASAELASALDPVVLAELTRVASVEIVARPALDLPSMQLTIDCVGENPQCLSQSAQQAEAEGLVAPSVRQDGQAIVVTLLRFSSGRSLAIQAASRRYAGERAFEQALAGISELLTELFGAAKAEPVPPPSAAEPAAPPAEPDRPAPPPVRAAPAAPERLPIAAIAVGAAGVVLVGTAIGLGIRAKDAEAAYLETPVNNAQEAKERKAEGESAQLQATLANVALGVGVGTLVAAGVLLFSHLRDQPAERARAGIALVPAIGPRQAGLTLTAAGAGL